MTQTSFTFQVGVKLKQISQSTNSVVTLEVNTYTNTMQTFKSLPLFKADP